jgi:16S rRNA (cytosine(1402)-N(4))-methyltransferase
MCLSASPLIFNNTHHEYADALMASTLGKEHQFQIDGALFDLGVSSYQIDQPDRGFAHRFDGALDMRMDRSALTVSNEDTEKEAITALELINNLSLDELAEVFSKYGDESRSQAIAREIVLSRPLGTTADLKDAICSITPTKYQIKTLSRCFQALRIAVNNELTCLEEALAAVHRVTKPGGRLVVLSYHSLEDRVVKDLFRRHGRAKKSYKYNKEHCEAAECADTDADAGAGHGIRGKGQRDGRKERQGDGRKERQGDGESSTLWRPVFKKPVVPSRQELKANSRSRSAKLRVAERV